MAVINNLADRNQLVENMREMSDAELLGQDISQQSAIHAISHLLMVGVNQINAQEMLVSLRAGAQLVRDEYKRRGRPSIFSSDQTESTNG